MQGIHPGIRIRRETLVTKQEKNLDFATLFLGFFEDEEFFALVHNFNEVKQITFLQRHSQFMKAAKYFFENGGQRLYLLNFPVTDEFDHDEVSTFLQDHCDTLSDLETICTIGLLEGLLSDEEISIDEALKVIFHVNTYAAQTDRLSISDINETIKESYLDRLGETVIYYPWFIDQDKELIQPSVVASALASKLAFEGKFFHSTANKQINYLQKLSPDLSKNDIDKLCEEGINPIKHIHTKGLRIWGVKAFNSRYESVNEMRVLKYVKRNLKRIGSPYLFEANSENLHDRLYSKIHQFLYVLWESGALAGASAEEAFDINTTKKSLDGQRNSLLMEISIAISKPLEFIVIRLNRIENSGAQESLSVEG